HVVPALGRVRSVLAEGRDRGVDDVRLDPLELLVAEPEPVQGPDAEVFGHHVRVAHELLEKLDAARGFELTGDTELVAITTLRRRHALLDAVALALDAEGDALPPALPRLDFDHPCAHVGQEHRAEGHGDDLAQVQHRDVAQRLIHVPSVAAKPAPPGDSAPGRPVGSTIMPVCVRPGDSIESCTAGHSTEPTWI